MKSAEDIFPDNFYRMQMLIFLRNAIPKDPRLEAFRSIFDFKGDSDSHNIEKVTNLTDTQVKNFIYLFYYDYLNRAECRQHLGADLNKEIDRLVSIDSIESMQNIMNMDISWKQPNPTKIPVVTDAEQVAQTPRSYVTSSAFSIVEMAVVLAIIGILISGVIITKGIVDKAKIVNAQTLTESSIVNDLSDNLTLWHETSFFEKDIIVDSNNKVKTWVNRNPKIIDNARTTSDATCDTSSSLCINQPQLIEDGELRIPFVRFAVNQLLKQNALSNLNKSFSTIFVVSDNSNNIFTLDQLWQSPEITKKYIKIIKNYNNTDQINVTNNQIGSNTFAGDVFEIIAFNAKFSQEQIDQIKAYLVTKYKL
jgi:type II secretory pathway pseudopilin PulG